MGQKGVGLEGRRGRGGALTGWLYNFVENE